MLKFDAALLEMRPHDEDVGVVRVDDVRLRAGEVGDAVVVARAFDVRAERGQIVATGVNQSIID